MLCFPSLAYCRPSAELPELGAAFKALGCAIIDVGLLLARHCDTYVASVRPGYERGGLERIISQSRCAKGRLLHYYPQSSSDAAGTASCSCEASSSSSSRNSSNAGNAVQDDPFSSWCGWHLDHGSLTGELTHLPLLLIDSKLCHLQCNKLIIKNNFVVHTATMLSMCSGLVPAMYLDSTGAEVTCPDPDSGLYVRSRAGRLIKAVPPPGCLLFLFSTSL
jgi:hypothetical protein